MENKTDSRDRLLLLIEMLFTRASKSNPITTAEIIQAMDAASISAERKSIYKDIQALQRNGFNVQYEKGSKSGYWLESAPYMIVCNDVIEDYCNALRKSERTGKFFQQSWND